MKNNRETKNKNRMVPAILLVLMVLASTCAFAQSGGSKLLYKGDYNEGVHVTNGVSVPNDVSYRVIGAEVSIYEDKIDFYGNVIEFKKNQNGKRVYQDYNNKVVVDADYNFTYYYILPGWDGNDIVTSARFTRIDSYSSQGSNYGGGGTGTYTGGTTGSTSGTSGNSVQPHQITEDCPICHGSGKCNTCDGKHWYWNTYTGNKTTCPNCKPDGRCTHCGGSGKVTKTKYY